MTLRGFTARLLLVVFATAIGLLLSEGAGRVVERIRCRELTGGWQVRAADYGWGNRPGAGGWGQRCLKGAVESRAYTRINRHGLRDRELPYERTTAYRILVLGDSFTLGMAVDQDQTFPKLLERRLNGAAPPGTHVEVLNAGVSAWGTDNELLYYRTEGWRYRPDLVVLAFDTTNDVFENTRRLVASSAFWPDKPYFALDDGHLRLHHFPLPSPHPVRRALTEVLAALERHSAAFRAASALAVFQRFLLLPPPSPPPDLVPAASPFDVYLRDYPEAWREGWRITRGLVLRLRQEVEAHGGRFAVMVINAREEVAAPRWEVARMVTPSLRSAPVDVDKPNRLITQFLARRGIPAIPLLDAFRAEFGATNAIPGYFAWDIHWAPAGHALAARILDERLHALHLVPDAPG